MRRFVAIPVLFCAASVLLSVTFAQQQQHRGNGKPADVDPVLWQVLEYWEAQSSRIERLQGDVLKRTYDTPFQTETVGEGRLFYESPDKGRLDMKSINPKDLKNMIAKRNQPDARVQRGKDGKPFRLVSGLTEKWVCDGQRLISVNEEEKTAEVAELPDELQGQNIMNGPLPFLFGLPAKEAVARFDLKLVNAPSRTNPIAKLTAFPKLRSDQQNWMAATIYLDTQKGLPTGIQLRMPGESKREVYQFFDLKVNARQIPIWLGGGGRPFALNLRGYNVKILKDSEDGASGNAVVDGNSELIVPNLIDMKFDVAQRRLKELGLARDQVKLLQGAPATRAEDVYRVQKQVPPANTRMKPGDTVKLTLWTDGAKQAQKRAAAKPR